MQFHFEIVNSKFGKFYILDSKQGLHFILKNNDKRIKSLKKNYNPIKGLFNKNIAKVFQSNTTENKTALKVKIKFLECSEFQKIVWKELLKINYGKTISYSEVANLILYPKAVRAVASAVGKNPISIIVPCHRVIRKNGLIGDYAWGVKMKRALLDVEV
jgi:O-6-methylguanine DNA methyltransferase